MSIKKAIIPATGLGTRFLPATKAQPKEMLPVVDKPALQYIVEEAVESGIEEILIITGRNKKSIEDHFDKSLELEIELTSKGRLDLLSMVRKISNMVNIHYIRQKELKGLGHAIYCAKSFIGDEPFAILLGDDIVHSSKPCLKQMIEIYDIYKTSIIGVQEVDRKLVNKYGIIDGIHLNGEVYRIKDLIEKPSIEDAPSNIAILGRYIINPSIFGILENTKKTLNGEIQLTDALKTLTMKEEIYAYKFEGKHYDIGDKLGLLEANIEFALRREDLKSKFLNYLLTVIDNEAAIVKLEYEEIAIGKEESKM